MTAEQRSTWARLARAAAASAELCAAQRNSREVNRELFEATIAAVLAGLPLGEVAEAICAGWPQLVSGTRSRTWRAIWSARPAWTATACTWMLEDLVERASR